MNQTTRGERKAYEEDVSLHAERGQERRRSGKDRRQGVKGKLQDEGRQDLDIEGQERMNVEVDFEDGHHRQEGDDPFHDIPLPPEGVPRDLTADLRGCLLGFGVGSDGRSIFLDSEVPARVQLIQVLLGEFEAVRRRRGALRPLHSPAA
jgi:hypothetical protein